MRYGRFLLYNVAGGVGWIVSSRSMDKNLGSSEFLEQAPVIRKKIVARNSWHPPRPKPACMNS
jgi:hypothetical protein